MPAYVYRFPALLAALVLIVAPRDHPADYFVALRGVVATAAFVVLLLAYQVMRRPSEVALIARVLDAVGKILVTSWDLDGDRTYVMTLANGETAVVPASDIAGWISGVMTERKVAGHGTLSGFGSPAPTDKWVARRWVHESLRHWRMGWGSPRRLRLGQKA